MKMRLFYCFCFAGGALGTAAVLEWRADAAARAFAPTRPAGVRSKGADALLPPGHAVYSDDRGEWVVIVLHGNYILCQWLFEEKRWLAAPLAARPAPVVDLEEANKNGFAKHTTRTAGANAGK